MLLENGGRKTNVKRENGRGKSKEKTKSRVTCRMKMSFTT